ncbi:MAG: hypothetical protein ACJ787_15785 [Myxococcales bacterium]
MNTDDPTETLDKPRASAAARILARSFYRELRSHGYTPTELVAVSAELIELVTLDLRSERQEGGAGFAGDGRRPKAAASEASGLAGDGRRPKAAAWEATAA